MRLRGGWTLTYAIFFLFVQAADGVEPPADIFEQKLDRRVAFFDNAGRPLGEALIALAFENALPIGIEYVDGRSVHQPIRLKVGNSSVRQIFEALVSKLPPFRVVFGKGTVQVYSHEARNDPSNLLNTVIDNFEVRQADVHAASADLFNALVQKIRPAAVVSSTAVGSAGGTAVTLRVQHARVYEILDEIVARHGSAMWLVQVPPERLSKLEGRLWYVYGLDPAAWEGVALDSIRRLFPSPH